MLETLISLVPSGATIVVVLFVLWAANSLLQKQAAKHVGLKFRNQMVLVGTLEGRLTVFAIDLVLAVKAVRRFGPRL